MEEKIKNDCEGCKDCGKSKTKEPSMMKKVSNLIKETANHVKGGFQNVSDEKFVERAKICDSCVYFIKESNKCEDCGCYMPIKARWKISKCPKGEW